jgi:hypothetical protein
VQARTFKESANSTLNTIQKIAPQDGSVNTQELQEAQSLLAKAEQDLQDNEKNVRFATDRFHGTIIVIAVAAIICAILGLLCVFVRVRSASCDAGIGTLSKGILLAYCKSLMTALPPCQCTSLATLQSCIASIWPASSPQHSPGGARRRALMPHTHALRPHTVSSYMRRGSCHAQVPVAQASAYNSLDGVCRVSFSSTSTSFWPPS